MSKAQVARFLRFASYAALAATIAWSFGSQNSSCRGVGCLGNAIAWLVGVCGILLLGSLLNWSSFLLQARPRSLARKAELWVLFVAPTGALLGMLATFAV